MRFLYFFILFFSFSANAYRVYEDNGVKILRGGTGEELGVTPAITFDENEKLEKGMYKSGTGFFVSRAGHILTNAHVIHGCRNILVLGSRDKGKARLLAVRKQYDLALLKVDFEPSNVAKIRRYEDRMSIGNHVAIHGFPAGAGKIGKPIFTTARITELKGPVGEEEWYQFSNSAKKGNSGGPLLDSAGNAIGVVSGKFRQEWNSPLTGRNILAKEADLAVSLRVMREFLMHKHVPYLNSTSESAVSDEQIRSESMQFIVQILCGN